MKVDIIEKSEVPTDRKGIHSEDSFSIFDGLIYDWRQEGASLQEIGDKIGRSRERVRQILCQHYGDTVIGDLITTKQLAEKASCEVWLIHKLKKAGLITPIAGGWPYETLSVVIQNKGKCRMCGKLLPLYHSTFCSEECRIEGGKCKNRPLEVQQKQNARCLKAYHERKKNREYEIISKFIIIPINLGGLINGL